MTNQLALMCPELSEGQIKWLEQYISDKVAERIWQLKGVSEGAR